MIRGSCPERVALDHSRLRCIEIEAFQLLIILLVMPCLVVLTRTRIYGPFRIAGGVLTGIAAAAWFAERAFGWSTPIDSFVESIASHALWLFAGLIVLAIVAMVAGRGMSQRPFGGVTVAGHRRRSDPRSCR
jgi:hypothetical protein